MSLEQPDRMQAAVPPALMATFLLREHIRYRRRADQARVLKVDVSPTQSPGLARVLTRITTLLPAEVTGSRQ